MEFHNLAMLGVVIMGLSALGIAYIYHTRAKREESNPNFANASSSEGQRLRRSRDGYLKGRNGLSIVGIGLVILAIIFSS